MADFSALKTSIQNYIKQNGNNEITGNILQSVLLSVVNTMGDGAINDLVTALTNEVNNRTNAVGTEATARQDADTALGGRINTEAMARENADTALGGRIDGVTAIVDTINSILSAGYVYKGIATPSTNPNIPLGRVYYIATASGTYTNFGNLTVSAGINILKYNGSAWSVDVVISFDDQPTAESGNLVKSGGVYLKINQEKNRAEAAEGTLQQNITAEKNRSKEAEDSLHQEIQSEENERKQEIQDVRDDVFSLIHDYQPIVIEGNVVNAPDEEDITQQPNNLLKFKDKAYNPTIFSGMGRKYLRKNVVINEDYVTFDGFLENPECEDLLVGTPDAILWARLPERFVAQKDDTYYLDWEGSEDYIPVNADKIYVNDNIPYTWNGEDLIVDDNLIERYGNTLMQEMMSDANTIYVIQYDFTLGEDITVPENCVLHFDGGSISGEHTITGNNTGVQAGLVQLFDNKIVLAGNWEVKESYSEWFDTTGAYHNNIIANLAVLSKTIKLKEDSTINLKKQAQVISIDTLYSDSGKATLSFDCGSEGEFNDNNGLWIESFNFLLKNIKVIENFDPSTTNTQTVGNTLAVSYTPRNKDVSAKIINCEFTGSFSSSCFASSDTTDLLVDECNFHDIYLSDHAVYCSTIIRDYKIQNTTVTNVGAVSDLFKIRESPIFRSFILDNVSLTDHNSYVINIQLLGGFSGGNVVVRNVKTSKTANDKTRGLFAIISANASAVLSSFNIDSCNILDGGKYTDGNLTTEYPLINHNGSNNITVNKITIKNTVAEKYLLQCAGNMEINNSKITQNLSSLLMFAYLTNIKAFDSEFVSESSNQFLYNIPNIAFVRCKIASNATFLARLPNNQQEGNTFYIIKDCNISVRGNYFTASSNTSFRFYFICDGNVFTHNESSVADEVTGTTEKVILNRKGATPGDLMRGFCYYDKTLGKPIWWNGSAWVDATGATV